MTPAQKLKLLLVRDFVYFAVVGAYFFLPGQTGLLLLFAVIFFAARPIEKRLKASDAKLDRSQKRIYFSSTSVYYLALLGLLLSWIIRHSSPPAWAIGSVASVVLLVMIYASYDAVFGRNAKI